ncbi:MULTISPECIES: ankyrin repeat domain-containing protein [unclassified Candidatus Cardinium]|uniref:ankyrin repeat domain-containing protein n=1 Tax=unclassified Candidatus Cardinium TaxID=2641185 RepID=UPI001FB40B26|nr:MULTISPECIES: ankyrin repeat domain-containing protein [unclassified Candidatus Cardinium]
MITNTHQKTKQKSSIILRAKQIVATLGCLYFCTGLETCSRHRNNTPNIKKDSLPYKDPPSDTSDQDVSKDYHNLDKCLCEVSKSLKGDTGAMDFLVERGRYIDAHTPYKPGSVRVAIVKNSGISLILEYARNGKLSYRKQSNAQPVTLMIASLDDPYRDPTAPPPSYEKATNNEPPSYEEATDTPAYISFMKRLIEHKIDLNGWNTRGETLLTEVIKNGDGPGQIEVIKLLLEAGVNPNGISNKMQTPLELVKKIKNIKDQEKTVKLLIDYGANPLWALMDETTKKHVRNTTINHPEKVSLDSYLNEELTNVDKRLQSFFNQKYSKHHTSLSGQVNPTCVVCHKKKEASTTIQIASCGHYAHGSCLVRSFINQSKGHIKFTPFPSYVYQHLCPCCKEDITHAFTKDLSEFYTGIKFKRVGITLIMRLLLAASISVTFGPFSIYAISITDYLIYD